MSYNLAVPKKPNPTPRQLKVGDKIRVSMHGGKIVDAAIKAILDTTVSSTKLLSKRPDRNGLGTAGCEGLADAIRILRTATPLKCSSIRLFATAT
jgi:hypothetical protein